MDAQAVFCRSAQPAPLHKTEFQTGASLGTGTGKASQMYLHESLRFGSEEAMSTAGEREHS